MRFGDYEIEGHLGAGGMSSVWLARSRGGNLVVLKRQLNPADDARLRDEASVGLRLRHPNIVHTLGLFEHEARPILVLEYVAGASLVALRKRGPLPPAAVCCIGADLACGLTAIHEACDEQNRPLHVVHRDVSPANVIVTPDGNARLIDLGIARFAEAGAERTGTGELRGTLRYLAPELFDAKQHTPKTDLWALGVCLFEAALGRQAVTGPEAVILACIVRGQLLDLRPGEAIEPTLALVIKSLCAREDLRFTSGDEAAGFLLDADTRIGGGRALASAAVYAVVTGESAARRGPAASSDDNAFVKFAATTYCSRDDDDLFGGAGDTDEAGGFDSNLVVTAATPVTSTRGLVPAPVTVHADAEPAGIVAGLAVRERGVVGPAAADHRRSPGRGQHRPPAARRRPRRYSTRAGGCERRRRGRLEAGVRRQLGSPRRVARRGRPGRRRSRRRRPAHARLRGRRRCGHCGGRRGHSRRVHRCTRAARRGCCGHPRRRPATRATRDSDSDSDSERNDTSAPRTDAPCDDRGASAGRAPEWARGVAVAAAPGGPRGGWGTGSDAGSAAQAEVCPRRRALTGPRNARRIDHSAACARFTLGRYFSRRARTSSRSTRSLT